AYSPVNDPNAGFYANNPQIPPFDQGEWQWAAHIGIEHRFNSVFAVFARAARAFRLGNADERVGAGSTFTFTVPTFDLKTQTSYDVEGGVRVNTGPFSLQSSVYLMRLNNEIHFLPAVCVNIYLDPTFRDGPLAGNEIPLISRWSGYAGFSWDILPKLLALDVTSRLFGPRRMDNDQ